MSCSIVKLPQVAMLGFCVKVMINCLSAYAGKRESPPSTPPTHLLKINAGVNICPLMLNVDVHDAIMSAPCLTCDSITDGTRKRDYWHIAAQTTDKIPLCQSDFAGIGCMSTACRPDTGVVCIGPTNWSNR